VLLVRGEGRSYGVAGLVVAAVSLASGIGQPLAGRLVDRIGHARILLPLALAYPAALAALTIAATADAPVAVLAACGALCGAAMPPVGSCMRALWPDLLTSQPLRETAYALEAWLQELFFILGPLVVAAIASVAPPWCAVMAAAACGGLGTASFALAPPVRAAGGSAHPPTRAGALGAPAVRTVMAACFALGGAFGVVEVTMPAFAEAHGSRAQGGFALACFALGSLVGGLWIGARSPARRPDLRFAGALALLGAALLTPLVAPSLAVMCVLMFAAGAPIAPAFAASYSLVGTLAPPGTTTEAFAWLTTAIVAGLALGTSGGGAAVGALGITGAIALAAPCAGIAALVAFAWRGSLALPEPVR
jgi:MFS family permease